MNTAAVFIENHHTHCQCAGETDCAPVFNGSSWMLVRAKLYLGGAFIQVSICVTDFKR